jgi:hypothetical protein
MPSGMACVVHVRLTRRDYRGDVLELTTTDKAAFAVAAWHGQHPDVAVGTLTVVAEGLDSYAEIPVPTAEAAGQLAGFVTWMTEAPAHVHEVDATAGLPGALGASDFADLVPGSLVEFLLEGTWYPGEVRAVGLADIHRDPMLIVTYTGEPTPNPKILKGRIDPGDGFHVYAGEVRPVGTTGPTVAPPRPTVHVVRDAVVRVYGAAPDSNGATDTYVFDIGGVKILCWLSMAGDTDAQDTKPTVYVAIENVSRPKGTRLIVNVHGDAREYRI